MPANQCLSSQLYLKYLSSHRGNRGLMDRVGSTFVFKSQSTISCFILMNSNSLKTNLKPNILYLLQKEKIHGGGNW
jgi:hypothetical protein